MRKRTLKERLQYKFDIIMSKGTIALIGLLCGISVIVVGIAGLVAVLSGKDDSYARMTWVSLMHTMDPGTLAASELDNLLYIGVLTVMTLYGIFVTSILIGIITTGFEQKLKQLRKGTSTVVEEGHTVILGFNDNIYTLLNELIEANSNHKNGCIVVAGIQEKEEMEEDIAAHIKDFKTTRVICRSGPLAAAHTLERCAVERSRSVIVNLYDDAETIKVILALTSFLKSRQLYRDDLYITAAIEDEQNVAAARIAGEGRAEVIHVNDAISRIIAHTCRQPGLSNVLIELFDYDGDELYFEKIPELYGKTLKELLNLFPKAVVFGIRKEDGPHMNPPMDTRLEKGDEVILLEEDDGSFEFGSEEILVEEELIVKESNRRGTAKENLLILGTNSMLPRILAEFDCYVAKDSLVKIVAEKEVELDENVYRNIVIEQIESEGVNPGLLEELVDEGVDAVLILSSEELEPEASDAQTLLRLIFLRDISQRLQKNFTITSEMKKSNNQRLAAQIRVEDLVIGSNIVNLIMTQIAENRELQALFEDILDEEGSELYMKPIGDYVKTGVPVNFYTLTESASRKGHIAVGYKQVRDGKTIIVTNPQKSERAVYVPEDYLIVIAED